MIGYSGLREQGYNAKTISKWCHGVGLVNRFAGEVWVTTLAIEGGSTTIAGKKYIPVDPDSWRTFRYKAELRFVAEDQELPNGMDSKSGSGKNPSRRK